MANALDHVIFGSPRLQTGAAFLEENLGISPQPGGRHKVFGTKNVLAGLGPDAYLEVLVPDDANEASSALKRVTQELPGPALYTFVVRTPTIDHVMEKAAGLGLKMVGPVSVERKTSSGDLLQWRMLFPTGHDFGSLIPTFIDWGDTPNPALSLPAAGRITDFSVTSPQADDLKKIFDALDIPIPVLEGAPALTLRCDVDGLERHVTSAASPGLEF